MNGSTAIRATWAQQIAIAAAYAAAYDLARYMSLSHWAITAGLRLACLFLVPIRFWPALLLGEAIPSFEIALTNGPDFGVAWAVAAAVPVMVLWMPIVRPMRRRNLVSSTNASLHAGVLLLAALGCALVTAIFSSIELQAALLAHPGEWPDISAYDYFWSYLLGAYLGALTLTPTLLALHMRAQALQRVDLASIWRSPLTRDVIAWALPVCAGTAWVANMTTSESMRVVAHLALLLPLFAMALRHGWHGAAVGGMLASAALAMTDTGGLEPEMMRCQAVLALCISAALLVTAKSRQASVKASPARAGR